MSLDGRLQDCGTIQLLEPFLRAGQPGPMQLEALSALYNLCKISKVRQEAAAVAHAVPHLTRLASAPAQVRNHAYAAGHPQSLRYGRACRIMCGETVPRCTGVAVTKAFGESVAMCRFVPLQAS